MKSKKLFSVLSIMLVLSFGLSACSGTGIQGEQGLQGIQGVQGIQGEQGEKGDKGDKGENGTKVTIGENGNWFLDGVDTGIKADGTGSSAPEVEDDGYTPVVRFAVTSDLHLRDTVEDDYDSKVRLMQLVTTAYDYSESQTDYNKLDGIFFAGDQTQNGSETEQMYFFDFLRENTKAETTTRAVMGNHEFYATRSGPNDSAYHTDSMAKAPKNFLKYSGYDSVDEHLVINGFHYIFLTMDQYNTYTDQWDSSSDTHEYFSPAKLNWLDAELTKAKNDDPTGKKPIFVFQHEAPENTMVGSVATSGDADLTKVLEKYPQVVDFSGHTHRPLTDPRSIWQGTFTALNTGSLCYLGATLAGHPDYDQSGVAATNAKGSWENGDIEDAVRTGGLYYIVEVDANNVVRILRYNLFTNALHGEPIILDSIGNPAGFTYTNARKNASQAPTFAQGASLTLKSNNYKQVMIEIPQASCPDVVQNYRCDIYKGTTFVRSDYRLACTYYGDAAPSIIELPINNLSASTNYTVKVYAVNSWGKACTTPLQVTFTTTSSSSVTTPDIVSATFNTDGSAINAVTGKVLDKDGGAKVALNATVGKNVATFDGNDAYRYTDMTDWYPVMANGFTLETFIYLDEAPTSATGGYVDLISNQEVGGFGFEYETDGEVAFSCKAGGSYKAPAVSVSTGQWIHLVGVFDGSSIKIYKNGSLGSSKSAGGAFDVPKYYARVLCIGGDPGYRGATTRFFKGKIAVANLYSHALTASQISDKYNALKI